MKTIVNSLGNTNAANKIESLWWEYERDETPEAHFVHGMDKLELAQQAMEYEHKYGITLGEFFKSCDKGIHEPQLRAIFNQILLRRPKL
jgi:putative hydrolase of HD superfamily